MNFINSVVQIGPVPMPVATICWAVLVAAAFARTTKDMSKLDIVVMFLLCAMNIYVVALVLEDRIVARMNIVDSEETITVENLLMQW